MKEWSADGIDDALARVRPSLFLVHAVFLKVGVVRKLVREDIVRHWCPFYVERAAHVVNTSAALGFLMWGGEETSTGYCWSVDLSTTVKRSNLLPFEQFSDGVKY